MHKVRVLALLSLLVCISAFSTGFNNLNFNLELKNWQTWLWIVLTLFGIYGTIAAVSIVMLSFFALQPADNGSFIVDRKSVYGKIFRSLTCLDDRDHSSICQAFWKTNGILFLASLVIGMIVAIFIVAIKAGIINILLSLFGMACFIVFGAFSLLALEKLDRGFNKLKKTHPKLTDAIEISPFLLIAIIISGVVGGISYKLYSIGWTAIWAWTVAWMPWLTTRTLIICAVIAGCYGIYKLVAMIFGEEFSSFYHQNICPKIILQ